MGSVWQAEDLTLDAPAAVKLLEPRLINSAESLLRFQREAKATATIRSTNVVQILDYGVADGMPYIAMELLKGESLGERIARDGALEPALAITLLGQVARAVGLAHEQGIVHRDLKPDNIFLVRELGEDIAKVVDFGIAHQAGGLDDSGGLHTKTGAILGTPYYMSPEHLAGELVDERSDVWAFGVIAFECLTGTRPFMSDSFGGLMIIVREHELPVPSERHQVPVGFDEWFSQVCHRNKTQRTQTLTEAISGLRALANRPLMQSPRREATWVSTFGANAVSNSLTHTQSHGSASKRRIGTWVGLASGVLLLGLIARSTLSGYTAVPTASIESVLSAPHHPAPHHPATQLPASATEAPSPMPKAAPTALVTQELPAKKAVRPHLTTNPANIASASDATQVRRSAKSTVAPKPVQPKSNDIAGF
jgi:serine/threonine-protein kinase